MPCTTILVGKKASYDGSTMMARNEDAGGQTFDVKKFTVVRPEDQPRHYKSHLTGFEIDLEEAPMRYTSMPNALTYVEGIWAEAGFNEENVAMSATETITSNPRVLGADPLVPDGIGEEDMTTIVLPYIHSARDGVRRMAMLLEKYGTCEKNGIGFQDVDEIWWMETIGGHHWIAKRVPDDAYVVGPNQLGIDSFDFVDAMSEQKAYMCSADMVAFIGDNHLDVMAHDEPLPQVTDFDVRGALGSRRDSDHIYNTPRAWFMERYLNPRTYIWDGPEADYTPESDDLPWSLVPERLITPEDIKYVLSAYYQGTPYNPYSTRGDVSERGKYRAIGVNRNNFVAITQLRPYLPEEIRAVEWIAEGSNVFNTMFPFYGNVDDAPAYLRDTTELVTTENFYWVNRLIGVIADAHFADCIQHIERYSLATVSQGHAFLNTFDREYLEKQPEDAAAFLTACNQKIADYAREQTYDLLGKVLHSASLKMKNAFSRSDS